MERRQVNLQMMYVFCKFAALIHLTLLKLKTMVRLLGHYMGGNVEMRNWPMELLYSPLFIKVSVGTE